MKSGGTTLRFISRRWADIAVSNIRILPDERAGLLHPDSDRFLLKGEAGPPASLLERVVSHHRRRPQRIFVEIHSAPPSRINPWDWRGSQFCHTCCCILHVNLRHPKEWYESFLYGAVPHMMRDVVVRVSRPVAAKAHGIHNLLAQAWFAHRQNRSQILDLLINQQSKELCRQCGEPASPRMTRGCYELDAAPLVARVMDCLGQLPMPHKAHSYSWQLHRQLASRVHDVAPVALGLPFDVYGRTDRLADAYGAVMRALGEDEDAARRVALIAPRRASTRRARFASNTITAIREIAATAEASALADGAVFERAFRDGHNVTVSSTRVCGQLPPTGGDHTAGTSRRGFDL